MDKNVCLRTSTLNTSGHPSIQASRHPGIQASRHRGTEAPMAVDLRHTRWATHQAPAGCACCCYTLYIHNRRVGWIVWDGYAARIPAAFQVYRSLHDPCRDTRRPRTQGWLRMRMRTPIPIPTWALYCRSTGVTKSPARVIQALRHERKLPTPSQCGEACHWRNERGASRRNGLII
ncbi:hypothetical protein K431DRAFT_168445 [Polychaeton citri CBS 116435]|uniref:Uncharacterized protein n=1 Tax=Polychaeton citri CBS 116435 TaxID=1314669 RepID=A0A9P4Q1X4_9PEZI|nr:hypothetical protein K431DRAFT_168445 [Polychaeton citri CBS 116435]